MPRKDGIAENQSVDENDQNVIHEEEDVREESDQDPSRDLDEYLNHLPNYDPDDSYIDDEEFGSGINDNANRTVVVDKDTMPGKFTAAKKEQKKPAEAGPAGPFEPEKPIYSEIFSNHGEYQHPRTYYRVMYTTLKIFEKAPIKNVDDKIAYCRYLTALELLMDGQAESIRRRFPTYEDQQMEISMGLEEAWKVVHGRNKEGVRNLDRVMGIPLNGSTFGAIAAEKNDLPDYKHFITEAADYIRKRENRPYPGDEAVLEQLPYKYAGNRLFRSPEEFAAKLRANELPPELTMTVADIDRRLQEIAQPYMAANNGILDTNRMSEADRREYNCLNGAKNWRSTYLTSSDIGNVYVNNNPTVYGFKRELNMSHHFKVLSRHTDEPAFRSTVKQMNAFEQRAEMGFSLAEIREHGEALLQSRQVQRASGGLYGAIKAVGSGDMSRFEELVLLDDGYARLLALNHFAKVIQDEVDPRGEKIRPDMPVSDVINVIHNDRDFQRVCEEHAGDPLFRKAIASLGDIAAKNARQTAADWEMAKVNLRDLDRKLNRTVLQNTLAPADTEKIRNLQAGMGSEGDVRKLAGAVNDNMRKQAILAKFMFLAHVGNRLQTSFDGNMLHTTTTEAPAAELFAHGTRTRFNLSVGSKEAKRELNNAIYGENALEDGLVYAPSTASYVVRPHTFDEDGSLRYIGGAEKFFHLRGTRKFDIGIGGIGNIGPGGAVISDDGSSGVFNMAQRLGDDDEANTFEVNIEGAKYGAKSALGTPSDTRDNLNVLSGMLSRKESEEGKKNEIFLQKVSAENLTNLVNRFDRYYRKLQRDALTDPDKAEELAELNETLSGKTMAKEDLINFLSEKLGVNRRDARKLAEAARKEPDEPAPDADYEIAPPEDPYEGLDEEGVRAAKESERNELEGIILNKLYGEKLVQEEMAPNDGEEPALEEEAAPGEAGPVTLDQYLHAGAQRLGGLSQKEQNKLICKMIDAVNRNKGNLRAQVDPEKLDGKRIGKVPSVSYQLRHSQRELVEQAAKGKITALMSGITKLHRPLTADRAADNQTLTKLRELYNVLKVPNLEKRTAEYQNMVGAIGRVSAKTALTPEDKLHVINAVENYASKKRVVPNSENGKLSLNYGYEAIKAVAASTEAEEKFLRPLEANITRLQESMLRKGLIAEDRMIRLPAQDEPEDAQAEQNGAPAHHGGQQMGMPGNN